MKDAADALAIADGKIKTFYTASDIEVKPPIFNPESPNKEHAEVGDLLIYGIESNALYRCDGAEWKIVDDGLQKYIRQTAEGLEIGELAGKFKVVVTPTGMIFKQNDNAKMARYENDSMFAADGVFESQVIIGNTTRRRYAIKSREQRLTIDYDPEVVE